MTDTCTYYDRHKFTYSLGSGTKSDFEPVEYGNSAEDTLYKRVEYSLLACPCGTVMKKRLLAGDK